MQSTLKIVATPDSTSAQANVAPAPAPITTIRGLYAALCALFVERDTAIRLALLGVLARENVYYHGIAGIGKSAVVRAICEALNRTYFEYLLTKFTDPGEIFGGVDLPKWTSTGDYVRKTARMLPEAEIVFLDEVWKGSSAIVNTLLTVLNEKRFANGGSITALPLITCFGASNEIPEVGSGLDPIWDRFMIRHEMQDIAEDDNFVTMLAAPPYAPVVASVDLAAEQTATAAVSVPVVVLRMMATLRRAITEGGFHASPRRWRKSLAIIQANAHFEGRTVAEMDDLEVLENVLWREPKERAAIARIIGAKINPDGAKATAHADKCANLWDGLSHDARNAPTPADIAALSEAMADVKRIQGEASALKPSRKVDAERAKIAAVHVQLQNACMRAAGVKM